MHHLNLGTSSSMSRKGSAASRGGVCHYSVIIRGGGVSICVLTGKPEKWLHSRVVNPRQYQQAG
jgi:hypothetical protein